MGELILILLASPEIPWFSVGRLPHASYIDQDEPGPVLSLTKKRGGLWFNNYVGEGSYENGTK